MEIEPSKSVQRKSIGRTCLRWSLRIARIYAVLVLTVMLCENWLVYPAPKYPVGDWSTQEISPLSVDFRSADGTNLNGWYLECPNPRGYVLFCHGNGNNVAHHAWLMHLLRDHYGLSVFVFDYRGYGRSQGSPTEQGVLEDGEAAHQWLVQHAGIRDDQVLLWGQSLGGAVAVGLAARHSAQALILECSFDTMPDVAAGVYPWLPVRWLMRNRYPSVSRIANYQGPLLQIHGTLDDLVPIQNARRLFEACPSVSKQFVELPECGHNNLNIVKYDAAIRQLLESITPRVETPAVTQPDPDASKDNVLTQLENALIFPAPRYPVGNWNPSGLEHEDIFFESADGTRLHGWYVEPKEPRVHVLYCHGNGEHVAYQADLLRYFKQELSAAVFAWDYRGYGRSEGSPYEAGVLADGEAAQHWLASRAGVANDGLVLMGRSLGGAVAVHLAAKNGARGLVLESTFTSIRDVAAFHYPWIPTALMSAKFDSLEKIAAYSGPILMSHSRDDEIIPYALGERLFQASTSTDKSFLTFETIGHNELSPPQYYARLKEFLWNLPPSKRL